MGGGSAGGNLDWKAQNRHGRPQDVSHRHADGRGRGAAKEVAKTSMTRKRPPHSRQQEAPSSVAGGVWAWSTGFSETDCAPISSRHKAIFSARWPLAMKPK
jgi:hypothetical protein